jgi:hypothetical protein
MALRPMFWAARERVPTYDRDQACCSSPAVDEGISLKYDFRELGQSDPAFRLRLHDFAGSMNRN